MYLNLITNDKVCMLQIINGHKVTKNETILKQDNGNGITIVQFREVVVADDDSNETSEGNHRSTEEVAEDALNTVSNDIDSSKNAKQVGKPEKLQV